MCPPSGPETPPPLVLTSKASYGEVSPKPRPRDDGRPNDRAVLHHEEQRIAVFANLEDLADVGMIDRGHGHRLAAQALARARIGGRLGRQQLDRDLTIEPRVSGKIDLAHASRAESRENLVGPEPRAWLKG